MSKYFLLVDTPDELPTAADLARDLKDRYKLADFKNNSHVRFVQAFMQQLSDAGYDVGLMRQADGNHQLVYGDATELYNFMERLWPVLQKEKSVMVPLTAYGRQTCWQLYLAGRGDGHKRSLTSYDSVVYEDELVRAISDSRSRT